MFLNFPKKFGNIKLSLISIFFRVYMYNFTTPEFNVNVLTTLLVISYLLYLEDI